MLPTIYSYEYGFLGAVSGIRFPVSFRGANIFQSNYGGGVAMYHARVELRGELNFNDHYGAAFGGALRIGSLTLVNSLYNLCVFMCACLSVCVRVCMCTYSMQCWLLS